MTEVFDLVVVAPCFFTPKSLEAAQALCRSLSGSQLLKGSRSLRLEGVTLANEDMAAFAEKANAAGFDAALVAHDLKLEHFRAAFFDMDSTLVANETLDEMARMLGLGEKCAEITHLAMTGVIKDYAASLKARVELLAGLDASCIETLQKTLSLNPGVEALMQKLNAAHVKTFVVSSGFTIMTEIVRSKLSMSGTHSNEIEIVDGRFTGRVTGPAGGAIIDAAGKKAFVEKTMHELGLDAASAICAGDGSNDVGMVSAAGFGVGFRPKKVLAPHCAMLLNICGFDALLEAFADTAEVYAN